MTPILAEAVGWPGAIMALGMVWAVAFMVWAACKYGESTSETTTTEYEETPAYKETKITVPADAIKEILKEMGYPPTEDMTDEQLRKRIEEVMHRDYSEIMKKVAAAAEKVRERTP